MMVGRRQGWRRWVALCAAWLVALQTVATAAAGVAIGDAGGPADPFGGVICTHAGPGAVPLPPDAPAGHPGLPDCCLLGCVFAGAALAPPPPFALAPPAPRRAVAIVPPGTAETPARRIERTPRITRGPPAA